MLRRDARILRSLLLHSLDDHRALPGVVIEAAVRRHVLELHGVVVEKLRKAHEHAGLALAVLGVVPALAGWNVARVVAEDGVHLGEIVDRLVGDRLVVRGELDR